MGLLLGSGMMDVASQSLTVPYRGLFNEALPHNQEPKYALFLIFAPLPHPVPSCLSALIPLNDLCIRSYTF